ncbi:MAG: alpha/beta fold hydrolase, partial [Promethearchaeota archaeon]
MGVDHSYFRPSLDSLGDIFKLFFYDHRGHGLSGRPPIETITFEKLADDAEALRMKLGIEKIGIIGHSAGGYIALNYAIRHHNSISHLILIDTSPAFDYPEEIMKNIEQKNFDPKIIEVAMAPAAPTVDGFREQFRIIQPLYFFDYSSEIEKKVSHIIDKMIFIPEISKHQDALLEKYNVISHLKEIKVPTLILVGKDDFICPPSQAQLMHSKIPNSDLHVFEKCGHYPFWEASTEFL